MYSVPSSLFLKVALGPAATRQQQFGVQKKLSQISASECLSRSSMFTTVTFDPPAEHHPKLWVSDGNVVLSAVSLDKTRTILFRVHKSMLSDQSEVFASMFAMPQGQENEGNLMEMYEGLPLVRLPDSAEELDALVNALRDTFPLYERSTLSDTPIRVRPALSSTLWTTSESSSSGSWNSNGHKPSMSWRNVTSYLRRRGNLKMNAMNGL